MKTKRQIKAFILKTLLPYKENLNLCATTRDKKSCVYLSSEGKKCALGKWMKIGDWQGHIGYAKKLFDSYLQEDILLKPALEMGFTAEQWGIIQQYHDTLAFKGCVSQLAVGELERLFLVKLPELR